jgi:hypothetical protein
MKHIFEWGNTFVNNSMNHIFEWGNTFITNSPWSTYLNGITLSSLTLHEQHIWLNYVDHGELLTKVLLHSCMWFMENYWRKCYPIQICCSWRVTDESVIPFKYNTFITNSPWTT